MVILWLLGYFGECGVWLSIRGKVVRWEQQNEKAGFVLHKGCSHRDSAGQAESGSLGPINHHLHSFIQHIQTQTHISLPACADSSVLLLFNMWPYAGILLSLFRWRKKKLRWLTNHSSVRTKCWIRYTWGEKTQAFSPFIHLKECASQMHTNCCCIFILSFQVTARRPLGLIEFTPVSGRVWIGWRKWGGKRGIRGS